MEIALGPVLFGWSRERLIDFYKEVAEMDSVSRVYIGEVVCARRRGLTIDDMVSIGEGLKAKGKGVVFSTLAVVSNEAELDTIRAIGETSFPIEANDVSVFNMVDPRERELYAGPHIKTYNGSAVEFLKTLGVRGVTFPVELSGEAVGENIAVCGDVEVELFAHGQVPLAFSWRCYTSRAEGIDNKEECVHGCEEGGIEITTLDGNPVFTINGTSVLSAEAHMLAGVVEELSTMGVKRLRVSPEAENTGRIADIFKARIDGRLGRKEAIEELGVLSKGKLVDGWYHGKAGRAGKDALLNDVELDERILSI